MLMKGEIMKKFIKIMVPVLYLVIGAGGLISFELYFKDKINTEEVVVAKKDIHFKDKITNENIEIVSIKKDNAVKGVITPANVSSILNKNASINIRKGTQIYSDLVDQYDLIPNEKKGEFVAPIPKEWLFAVPGSLRRTYIADFYAIPDNQQAVIRSMAQQNDSGNNSKNNSNNNSNNSQGSINQTSNSTIVSNNSIDSYVMNFSTPILKNIRVASVKDDSNKEVTESKDNQDSATGSVSSLEIIGNDRIIEILKKYTQQGYKIYVVYKFDR